jgi:hypothetical protein
MYLPTGDGFALRVGFTANIDHMRLPTLVKVRKAMVRIVWQIFRIFFSHDICFLS